MEDAVLMRYAQEIIVVLYPVRNALVPDRYALGFAAGSGGINDISDVCGLKGLG